MTRLSFAGAAAVTLLFALGCGGNLGGPAEEPITPTAGTDAPTGDAPSGDDAVDGTTCCCEYTEDGATEPTHSVMLQGSCESWGYECVDDAACEQDDAEDADDADDTEADDADAPAAAPARAPITRPTGGSMSRPTGGRATRPDSRTRSGGATRPTSRDGGRVTRPR